MEINHYDQLFILVIIVMILGGLAKLATDWVRRMNRTLDELKERDLWGRIDRQGTELVHLQTHLRNLDGGIHESNVRMIHDDLQALRAQMDLHVKALHKRLEELEKQK